MTTYWSALSNIFLKKKEQFVPFNPEANYPDGLTDVVVLQGACLILSTKFRVFYSIRKIGISYF